MPVRTRVARQELESLSQVRRPSALESSLMRGLVSPASLSGDLTPISASALIPGRSSTGSEALVPSATTEHPSSAALSRIAPNIALLQR